MSSVTNARVGETHLEAWRRFLRAHAVVSRVLARELEESCGLPLPEYDVLVTLAQAEGGRLRMQELADAVVFSRSGLTRLVDRMGRDGLVTRERCRDDGRGTYAVITAAGRRRLRQAAGVHLRGVGEHFAQHLTKTEAATLARALGAVSDGNAA